MRKIASIVLIFLVVAVTVGFSQEKPAAPAAPAAAAAPENPLSAYNKKMYAGVKDIILRSADKMPEENYNFKPTEAVRSYGEVLGHVAESQYYFCSTVLGEKSPGPGVDKKKTAKADVVAALKEAFAYCDKAYDSLTDASGAQTVKFFAGDAPKLSVLSVNNMHTMEHYGNLVTYMRLKNIVPPSSEPRPQPKPATPPEKK